MGKGKFADGAEYYSIGAYIIICAVTKGSDSIRPDAGPVVHVKCKETFRNAVQFSAILIIDPNVAVISISVVGKLIDPGNIIVVGRMNDCCRPAQCIVADNKISSRDKHKAVCPECGARFYSQVGAIGHI